MKVLYVSDLDGTLITHNERISDYTLNVINGLTEKGLLFTYATARSLASAESAVKGLKHAAPVIVYNGALIVDSVTGGVMHSLTINNDTKDRIISVLEPLGVSPVVHARENGTDKILWMRGAESPGQLRYLSRRTDDKRLTPVASAEELRRGDAFFFACNGGYDLMKYIHDELEKEGVYSLIYPEVYTGDFWLEALPRGATKANAVARLKTFMACDKVVCFGDSANDSEMFDSCDEKYAVANADEWLKAKATGTIGYCEEDGVAKWLAANAAISR